MISKHIIIHLLISVISMGMMIWTSYYKVLPFFLNFYTASRFRVSWSLYNSSKVILSRKKYLPYHLELAVHAFTIGVSFVCYFLSEFIIIDKAYLNLVQENSQIFIITLLIWSGIFFMKKVTEPEISYFHSVNKLNLGYGAAIWYYKNYLNRILPYNFLACVRKFENIEGIQLPHKLYILCPKSCKVEKYIDNVDYIEASKDLPSLEIDHGGIVGRKYIISVYRIKYNGEFFRCALEYAQPLKILLAFKVKGKISLSEMYTERESFIKNLTVMLKDHKNSFEVCELVEYDDKTEKLHEIFSGLPSVQKFKCITVE